MLSKEEYVEQEFFFRTFLERLDEGLSSQEILLEMKNELLQVTRLPLVVSILLTEVKLSGKMHSDAPLFHAVPNLHFEGG